MHPFDRSLCRRTLGLAAVAMAVLAVVVVLTDEARSTAALRTARLSVLAPAVAALGALAALEQSRRRGELRALEALGASPWRVARGATVAQWSVGVLAVAVVLSPLADVRSLFPAFAPVSSWAAEVGGHLVDRAAGVRVTPAGAIELFDPSAAAAGTFRPTGLAAAIAVGPMAALAPPWIVAPVSAAARLAGLLVAAGLLIVLLHATAAGLTSPASLVLAAAPLGLQVWAHRRELGRLEDDPP